jgi:hypothetical protein
MVHKINHGLSMHNHDHLMLPCASLEERTDPSTATAFLMFGQRLEGTRARRPIHVVCLHSEKFPLHGSTTTESVLACLRKVSQHEDSVDSFDQMVNRDVVSMTIDYDIVPDADALRWHYRITGVLSKEHYYYPYTIFSRGIDILQEAMQREGDEFPTDPPGGPLCRISGRVTIELDVLSPSSDMSRYARRRERQSTTLGEHP